MEHDEATAPISLTDQEVAILRLIAAGQSTNKIADTMGLKPPTVMWYRKRLHMKFKVHNMAELVHKAGEFHLFDQHPKTSQI